MNFKKFLKDKMILIIGEISFNIYTVLILKMVKVEFHVIAILIGLNILIKVSILIMSFISKKIFYNDVQNKISKLDKKYLIAEVINKPKFYEGEIFYDVVKNLESSIIEEVNKYKTSSEEYKEYIEMFVHEVKTPILGAKLIIENNKSEITLKIEDELSRIETLLEQIIMYTKIGHISTDYSLKYYTLEEIVNVTLKKNALLLIENKIKVIKENLDIEVVTDRSWIQFIITQIISNSVKYMKCNGSIKFYGEEEKNNIVLSIEDNGIGISKHDIDRVFKKGFIGENGRMNGQATGMGLYICKKIATGIGLEISISSEREKGTIVKLILPKVTKL